MNSLISVELKALKGIGNILQQHSRFLTDWDQLHLTTNVLHKLKEIGQVSEAECMQIVMATDTAIDKLVKLVLILSGASNKMKAMDAFVEGVVAAGQPELANLLRTCVSTVADGPNGLECLLIPNVAKNVLQYLAPKELASARAVCTDWNKIGNDFAGESFQVVFKKPEMVQEFIISGNSEFCKKLCRFQFNATGAVRTSSHFEVYCEFFKKFGHQIKSLSISRRNSKEFVGFVFGDQVQRHLTELETLKLCAELHQKDAEGFRLLHLGKLRTVVIEATMEESCYGQIELLSKLGDAPCKITSLELKNHFCVGDVLDALEKVAGLGNLEKLALHSSILTGFRQEWSETRGQHAFRRMKDLRIPLPFLTDKPATFYRIMNSCQTKIERLMLESFDPEYLDALPELPVLKYLSVTFKEMVRNLDMDFRGRLPRLEKLDLKNYETTLAGH